MCQLHQINCIVNLILCSVLNGQELITASVVNILLCLYLHGLQELKRVWILANSLAKRNCFLHLGSGIKKRNSSTSQLRNRYRNNILLPRNCLRKCLIILMSSRSGDNTLFYCRSRHVEVTLAFLQQC